ncbi:unnamed protein product [Alopecurus aequalis]
MESTARSTAPSADTSLQSLAIREEGNKLAQQIPASEFKCMHCQRTFKTARGLGGHVKAHKDLRPITHRLARAGPETAPEFKCMHCSRTFKTGQARGGHVKVHKHLRPIRQLQKQEEHRRRAPSGPQVRVWSSFFRFSCQHSAYNYFVLHTQLLRSHFSAGSAVVPFLTGTGTGGLAPAQPSSAANGYVGHVGGREIGRAGHLGSLRAVTQGEAAHGIHNFPSLRSKAVPSNGGTDAGVHLGGQQDMPAVNPEETADGIDLTLRV